MIQQITKLSIIIVAVEKHITQGAPIGGQSLVADSSLAQEDVQLKEWSVVVVFCVT